MWGWKVKYQGEIYTFNGYQGWYQEWAWIQKEGELGFQVESQLLETVEE
jgi:hypothetical protein